MTKIVMVIVCDDAHKNSVNLLGCGDLFRDNNDNHLSSLACKIDSYDALHVEMCDWLVNFSLTLNYFNLYVIRSRPKKLQSLILFYNIFGTCMAKSFRV
jgi:hypothetical protein